MSRLDSEIRITPSVLDRLLDDNPDQTHEAPLSRQAGLRLLKQTVKRDIEWLLNTRLHMDDERSNLPQVSESLATFGLSDFTDVSFKEGIAQNRLRASIESALRKFEPRLEGVEVTLDAASETLRTVRFRIDARLRVDPEPEPVTFDSTLQLENGEFVVKGD